MAPGRAWGHRSCPSLVLRVSWCSERCIAPVRHFCARPAITTSVCQFFCSRLSKLTVPVSLLGDVESDLSVGFSLQSLAQWCSASNGWRHTFKRPRLGSPFIVCNNSPRSGGAFLLGWAPGEPSPPRADGGADGNHPHQMRRPGLTRPLVTAAARQRRL